MQVTETLSDGLKRAFAVVVPAADIETRRATRFSELAKQVNLPGFRPGKVPMPIVRQRFGGAVAAEVMEQSINEATQQLLSERDLRPAMTPKLEMVTDEPAAAGPAKDLEFKLELEVMPEIAIPDFASLSLTRHVAKVPDEDIEKALADLAERNRELAALSAEELAERGENPEAIKGDVLTVDFVGKIDGVAFPGGTSTDTDIDIGGSGFIPGFVEQIEGMRAGETRTIEVTFPAEYQSAELAGKLASFEITAKQLRKPVSVPLDDALAEKIGFDSLEGLRDVFRSMRQRRLDGMTRMRLKRDLLDALAEKATFAPPEALVDQEFEDIWRNFESSRANGSIDEEDKAKSDDQLRVDYRVIADRRVRLGLLLGEIGRINHLVVTQEEVNAAIRAEVNKYPGRETQMMEFYRKYPAAADSLRGPIFEDKVVDYVLDSAQVTDVDISVEELERDPEEKKLEGAPEGEGPEGESPEGESPEGVAPEGSGSEGPVGATASVEAAATEAEPGSSV